jgi:hypothetical protein
MSRFVDAWMSNSHSEPSIWSMRLHDTLSFETPQGIVDVLRSRPGGYTHGEGRTWPCWCLIAISWIERLPAQSVLSNRMRGCLDFWICG